MAFGIVLVGGVSGFIAAVVTLLLGYGFWQAMLNYWQVGTLALVVLGLVHLILYGVRNLNAKLDAEAAHQAKNDA